MKKIFSKLFNELYIVIFGKVSYARKIGVKIGKGCLINTTRWPSEPYLVEIGDYVRIARRTSFYTHGAIYTLRKFYNDPNVDQFGKIKVGDYSYIGENCMILQGVNIGKCCIIGGGSVVSKSVPDGCIVAGNPAKFIGYTADFYKRIKETNDVSCKAMSSKQKKEYLLSLPESAFPVKKSIKIPEL